MTPNVRGLISNRAISLIDVRYQAILFPEKYISSCINVDFHEY